jgi:molecular chaperone DnaJ
VFISVREHARFERRDYDIHSEQTISFTQAALGGDISTETIDGAEPLRIPAGTQPGQVFRLRGKGVQFLQSNGRGDHYVHVNVRIPTSLTDEQRQLLEQYASTDGEEPSEPRRFADKLKDFFTAP